MENETKPLISDVSDGLKRAGMQVPGWVRVGAVAAASALAGGLAATWFYRKTLTRLENAESEPGNSNFGIRNRE
jgi:hypothetical protein